MALKTYTVIGYYEEEAQVFADSASAEDAFQAMGIVSAEYADTDLVIVGAVLGSHMVVTPGDDNGSTAFASDLAELAPDPSGIL